MTSPKKKKTTRKKRSNRHVCHISGEWPQIKGGRHAINKKLECVHVLRALWYTQRMDTGQMELEGMYRSVYKHVFSIIFFLVEKKNVTVCTDTSCSFSCRQPDENRLIHTRMCVWHLKKSKQQKKKKKRSKTKNKIFLWQAASL